MTFLKWWNKNSMPSYIGNFEVRMYQGVTQDQAEIVWAACSAHKDIEIALLTKKVNDFNKPNK